MEDEEENEEEFKYKELQGRIIGSLRAFPGPTYVFQLESRLGEKLEKSKHLNYLMAREYITWKTDKSGELLLELTGKGINTAGNGVNGIYV